VEKIRSFLALRKYIVFRRKKILEMKMMHSLPYPQSQHSKV
jgi:hypothetical protein